MSQKALFIDRDGIINVDHGYVSKREEFEFTLGIFKLLRLFQERGYLLFVVTNQSGIGRGYYGEDDFHKLSKWMVDVIKKEDLSIEKVLYCPHTPEAHCNCRKPNTGMIETVKSSYSIDLSGSWMIGDKQSDIELAKRAGIANSIYIGAHTHREATFSFPEVEACAIYFQNNQGKL